MEILKPDFTLDRYGLHVRLVNEDDSEFIVRIRTNEKLGRYIHDTSGSLEDQLKWFRAYKEREAQGLDYYFMFELPNGRRLGTERIYDITDTSFVTGSWVFDQEAPYGAAFLGDIIAHEIAYEMFPERVHLHDIKKDNHNVLRYARLFNPKVIRETEDTYYFENDKKDFDTAKKRLLRSVLPVFLKTTEVK